MKEAKLYNILRPLVRFITRVFIRPRYLGLENIPNEGGIILAGNHTSILDPLVLIIATKRNIHFLAKQELWYGVKRVLFGNLGLIPVNRKTKDHKSLEMAEEYLKDNKVIGIFPEGTTEKGRGLLPFKMGTVKMAHDTNKVIIPFVIVGKTKIFGKRITIKFLEPIKVNNDLEECNNKLRELIKNNLEV